MNDYNKNTNITLSSSTRLSFDWAVESRQYEGFDIRVRFYKSVEFHGLGREARPKLFILWAETP